MNRLAIVLGMLAMAAGAQAQERNPLDAKLIVDAGWFFLSTDMHVRVNGETNEPEGSDVNYDDAFGIGDFNRFRADVLWRFADRHSIEATYFNNNRSGSRTLDKDVEFKGQLYPVGADVNANSDVSIAELSYQYAFMRRENYEIAGSFGIYYLDLKLGLDATVNVNGQTSSRTLDVNATTQAPLPVIGLRGTWRLPHNMYIDAHTQYLYINYDPYKGRLLDLKASFVWQCTNHVGVGVAYDDFRFRFDLNKPRFDGSLRWNYGGAMAFVSVMF
jgi:hypothetical protein